MGALPDVSAEVSSGVPGDVAGQAHISVISIDIFVQDIT